MRNLLELEESVLSSDITLQNGLLTEQINEFQNEIYQSGMSKFESSVKMSKIVRKSFDFFKSSGKGLLEENGIYWSVDDFAQKMFGWKRSYLYKMVKLSQVHTSKINKFKRDCTQLRERGEVVPVSVENCLKTIRDTENGNPQSTPRPISKVLFQVTRDDNTTNGRKKHLKIKGVANADIQEEGVITTCEFDVDELRLCIREIELVIESINQG
tara:strand:- start:1076 stop:1714 length:639 start_codon:yes stop_codon:yes gene_type:complete